MVREQNGHAIFWNGHLCEGDQVVSFDPTTFLLWTRCGLDDVPLGEARELEDGDRIICAFCRQFPH